MAASARRKRSSSESGRVRWAVTLPGAKIKSQAVIRAIFLDVRRTEASVFRRSDLMKYLRQGTLGGDMGRISIMCAAAAAAAFSMLGASAVRAQGTASLSGQVAILERPGETTEDLANVVVFLEPVNAASRSPLNRVNTVMALDKRQFSPRVRVEIGRAHV